MPGLGWDGGTGKAMLSLYAQSWQTERDPLDDDDGPAPAVGSIGSPQSYHYHVPPNAFGSVALLSLSPPRVLVSVQDACNATQWRRTQKVVVAATEKSEPSKGFLHGGQALERNSNSSARRPPWPSPLSLWSYHALY